MNEIEHSGRHRRILKAADVFLLIGFSLGLLGFAAGMMIGISIDPRVDMHGRLEAYGVGCLGLVVACFCRLGMAKDNAGCIVYGAAAVIAWVLATYQFGQLC